ncbi:hypothetical protein ACHAWC_000904, partial [Mediolabrus comicus]
PFVLYATDFYKLSSLLLRRVLLTKPVDLTAYKEKTKQLLLDQRPSNVAALKLLKWEKEFGLLQYYGAQEYLSRWWQARSKSSSSTTTSTSLPKSQANAEQGGTTARVAFMITSEQRQKLSTDLGYTQQDIRSFKPIEALLLIEHGVKRISSEAEGGAHYNFRTKLEELVRENEKLMIEQQQSSASSVDVKSEKKAESIEQKPQKAISPEQAEQAHVKADVAMALLSVEEQKVDDQQNDYSLPSREEKMSSDSTDNNTNSDTVAVSLVDDKEDEKTDGTIKSNAPTSSSRSHESVQVTPNDSTELHMKPDIAAAYLGSHLQKDEQRSGMTNVDVNGKENEDDGPCWYEVVMNTVDADADASMKEELQDDVVVALFATKEEAIECMNIKKKLGSGRDKKFSIRRRWNV